jgi:demethylmenaquinone methyltransferase / 2-methoxy-6-polyprenyl-1,4-benzoquinol methylase
MVTHCGIEIANRFFEGTGRSYGLIVNLCTVGFDLWWKEKLLRKIPPNPSRIVDQACGTGILTFKITRRFPSCRVTGVELRDEYLDLARAKARTLKLNNVDFILGRAEDVVVQGPVDCIISSYLAKYAELKSMIGSARAMLRRGGTIVVHDFTYPRGGLFLRLWKLYFKILQSAGAACFPEWKTVFFELPGFLGQTRWVSEILAELRKNGFIRIRYESLTWGTSAIISAVRG